MNCGMNIQMNLSQALSLYWSLGIEVTFHFRFCRQSKESSLKWLSQTSLIRFLKRLILLLIAEINSKR